MFVVVVIQTYILVMLKLDYKLIKYDWLSPVSPPPHTHTHTIQSRQLSSQLPLPPSPSSYTDTNGPLSPASNEEVFVGELRADSLRPALIGGSRYR